MDSKGCSTQIHSRTVQTLPQLWMFFFKPWMESIKAAANPSLLCEPRRSKLCFTEAKVVQRFKPRERNRFPPLFSVICLQHK